MESKNFVIEQVKELAKKYPFSNIKYYFENFDNDHFVCIGSKSDLDRFFSSEVRKIDDVFIKKFPNELLSFILLEDYLEFGESGELIYETKLPTIHHRMNVKTLSLKEEKDYEFKENIEFVLVKPKSNKPILVLDEYYAFAA